MTQACAANPGPDPGERVRLLLQPYMGDEASLIAHFF
jgi:hypothetical protein